MLKAVIFDFDGVITDSEVLHLQSFNAALAEFGVELSRPEYYKDFLGLSDRDLINELRKACRLELTDAQAQKLAERKSQIFKQAAAEQGQIISGVREFCEMLEARRIPMAICSGAVLSEIMLVLENSGMRRFFLEIVSADQVRNSKPHPEGFLLVLKRLNDRLCCPIEARECVVIEDARWGIAAAHAAGMKTVAVTNTYSADELTMAHKVVANLNELSLSDLNAVVAD